MVINYMIFLLSKVSVFYITLYVICVSFRFSLPVASPVFVPSSLLRHNVELDSVLHRLQGQRGNGEGRIN